MIQQHERLIYKVCNVYAQDGEDSKDLFQEVILQAWKAYPKFEGRSLVSTWLYRVALNTAITHERKKQRSPDITYPDMLQQHPEDNIPDAWKEEYGILQQLIAGLPKLEKALVLLYLEDRSYKEIAEIMGITVSNAGAKLSRIREKLKKKAQPFINY